MKSIFLIDKGQLVPLTKSDYDTEDLLQQLIADHSEVLGSATGADGGLLLVRREQPVPDSAESKGRWSLDHLFIDRQGVPVLVEVKRASDRRSRREVVAQMLDYAANGVAYWPVADIIDQFSANCRTSGRDPEESLSQFLGEHDVDGFWHTVESNLKAGRIRMVFLADIVPPELRRIVEFLNEQMRPAEVLAVEVTQYVHPSGVRTLVPQLVGATERAAATKAISAGTPPKNVDDWLMDLEEIRGSDAKAGAVRAIDWLGGKGAEIAVSSSGDSILATFRKADGSRSYPFSVRRSTVKFEVSLRWLANVPFYRSDNSRASLQDRLVEAGMLRRSVNGYPCIDLSELLNDALWNGLTPILREIISNIGIQGE